YSFMFWIIFFFFSSRRRHTIFSRDWSSDVCSSDLERVDEEVGGAGLHRAGGVARGALRPRVRVGPRHREDRESVERVPRQLGERSEERRVGKEGKVGRWSEQYG